MALENTYPHLLTMMFLGTKKSGKVLMFKVRLHIPSLSPFPSNLHWWTEWVPDQFRLGGGLERFFFINYLYDFVYTCIFSLSCKSVNDLRVCETNDTCHRSRVLLQCRTTPFVLSLQMFSFQPVWINPWCEEIFRTEHCMFFMNLIKIDSFITVCPDSDKSRIVV